MKKVSYDLDAVLRFFEDYNLGPWKLGKMLDIPGDVVKRYLIDGKQINHIWAVKIDAAINIIGSQYTAQPSWEVRRGKTSEDWRKCCGEWNEKFVAAINSAVKEEETQEEKAKDIIYLILLEDDPGEFLCGEDPICKRGGLDNYSVESFIKRIRERCGEYV